MRWAGCDSETPEGAKFCIECDSALKHYGPSGRGENLPQAKFCAACGSPVGTAGTAPRLQSNKRKTAKAAGRGTRPWPRPKTNKSPPAVRFQPTAAAAERRQLTVMFCSLVGSTAMQYLPVRSRVLTRLRSRQEQGERKNESRQDRAQSRWGSAHRGDGYERGGPKPR